MRLKGTEFVFFIRLTTQELIDNTHWNQPIKVPQPNPVAQSQQLYHTTITRSKLCVYFIKGPSAYSRDYNNFKNNTCMVIKSPIKCESRKCGDSSPYNHVSLEENMNHWQVSQLQAGVLAQGKWKTAQKLQKRPVLTIDLAGIRNMHFLPWKSGKNPNNAEKKTQIHPHRTTIEVN